MMVFAKAFGRSFDQRALRRCRRVFALLGLIAVGNCPAQADSVVVFNEIMYHPLSTQLSLEWVELHNQMAVNVDLSGWSLTGGIGFQFTEGTVIPGGGYLVVAFSPADLAASTGLTNVLGPYSGRLSNSGEKLELRNRYGRLMDAVSYGVDGDWPVGPDGAGVSLAKCDEDSASAAPESWRASAELGGTPGRVNFPSASIGLSESQPIPMTGVWKYEASGVELGSAWRAPEFVDEGWTAGAGLFQAGNVAPPIGSPEAIPTLFSSGIAADGSPLSPGLADPHYWLTASAQSTPPPPAIPAIVIQNHPAWLANNSRSQWLGPVNPGLTDVAQGPYNYRTLFMLDGFSLPTVRLTLNIAVDNELRDVLLNGRSQNLTYSGFSAFSGDFSLTNGFGSGTNLLEFLTFNAGTTANPAGVNVRLSGTGRRQYPANTILASGPTNYYFRCRFTITGSPQATALKLKTIVADGAVFYLNGMEVLRLNMPAGPVDASTLALSNVPAPVLLGPLSLPNTPLRADTNVLAVELHQGPGGTNDVLFGAELALTTTNNLKPPPLSLAFNELSPGTTNGDYWLELMNRGPTDLEVAGCILARRGSTNMEYVFPAQTLSPGGLCHLTQTLTGFGAEPGDRLFLYAPSHTELLDSVVVEAQPKARWPDGTGQWYCPRVPTPGASNEVTLNRDVVINEIMYHPPGEPLQPASYGTNWLLTITNSWRYHCLGQDLGDSWRNTTYDDGSWPIGGALFYNTASVLPAPKNTMVPLANNGLPITTWYFRTQFVCTGETNGAQLTFHPILDDGAVFYLNGVEVFRTNLPSGPISYSTLANRGVATAAYAAPFSIPAATLLPGTNLLAVEVHQFSTNLVGWDVAFGTELYVVGQLSPALPYRDSPESWVELFNRSTNTVDLAGWRLDKDIDYTFPSGSSLSAGGYLVIAKDVGYMQSNYPGLGVFGPFQGKLRRSGGRVRLADSVGNTVNEVCFFDSKPWPEYADGGGSSLELRDPWADNSKPEAWAASLESGRSSWTTFTNRAVAFNVLGPTLWNEFQMGLLDAGECLIDDLSVIESPSGTPVQLLQNGGFESGMQAWRVLGNHRWSRVETEPDNPANPVLHILASGPTESWHNHLETTYASGRAVTDGKEYQISFRAKWLAGNNHLNTRLYFDRVAETFTLPLPGTHGTPGAQNSTFAGNLGPTFEGLHHSPIVPQPGEPVIVTVSASDPHGVAAIELWWSANSSAWQNSPMSAVPAGVPSQSSSAVSPEYTNYAASLPGFPAGTAVQFFVRASDRLGQASVYPPGGTNSRALFKTDEGQVLMRQLHRFRLWMLPAEAELLHAHTNVMSNERLGLTVVYDDRVPYYDAGIHLQSSERGRDSSDRAGFTLRLPADQRLRGVQQNFTIDRSGGYSKLGGRHDEILLWHAVNHAGGVPGLETDLVQVFAPRATEDSTGLLRMCDFNGDYFDALFTSGSDGNRYTMEVIYYPTSTTTGDPQAPKLPQPDEVLNVDLQDWGNDPESYRWIFLQENKAEQDDYSQIIALNKTLSLGGAFFESGTEAVMEVDEWLRALAFKDLTGDVDTYTHGLNHNWKIYFRPDTGKALGLLWDEDLAFTQAIDAAFPGISSGNTLRLVSLPNNLRRYYNHLLDLCTTTMNSGHLAPWAAHYAGLLGQDWSGAVSYIQQRAAYVRSFMPLTTSFTILNNGGKNFSTTNSPVALFGTAPLSVYKIEVNGVVRPVTWTSLTNWTLDVPLAAYANFLALQGIDNYGNRLTNATGSIVVTNLGMPAPLPVVINEWMADNAGPGGFADPLDGKFQDWFELFNPNNFALDLSGYHLTDTLSQPAKWTIPTNTIIGARGFLLVWADNQTNQNGQGIHGDLHANFQLNNGGEAIGLYAPDGAPQCTVVFGAQLQNVSQGLFPDGNTNTLYFLTNWTPRAANLLGTPPGPQIGTFALLPNGFVRLEWSAVPGRTYRVEYKDDLNAPDWTALGTTITAVGPLMTITDDLAGRTQRFYRVAMLQ